MKIKTSIINKILVKRSTMPVLSNVHLIQKDKKLSVIVTDFEVSYIETHEHNHADFDIITPGKQFIDLTKKGINTLSFTDKLTINGITLPHASGDEYPVVMTTNETKPYVPTDLSNVLTTVSKDPTRYHLNGVYFDANNIVSTDGHRLTVVPSNDDQLKDVILFDKGCEALNLIPDVNSLGIVSDWYQFSNGHQTVIIRRISGTYPKYNQFMPKTYNQALILSTKTALVNLKQLRPLIESRSKNNTVRIQVTNGVMTATYKDNIVTLEMLDQSVNIETIGFNYFYLVDALESQGLTTTLHLINKHSPVLFDDKTTKHLLMPVRV